MSAAPKRGLASLADHTLLQTWRISMEEVNIGGKNAGNVILEETFAALYCAIFITLSQILEVLRTGHPSPL